MSWFRQQRIASLEVNLADLYYDETKWGWADKLKKRYHGDLEARTKPYRCADCDQPHGPFNNIGSGQSNKPEVTYRLVCDRCWGPKPAAPVEVTDGEARITDEMELAGAKALWRVFKGDRNWDHATPTMQDYYREQSRACLSAALTQKGEV